MGKFSKYGGDIVITIDKEELRLKRVKTEKLQALLNLAKDEEHLLEKLVEYFTGIISTNYPDEPKEDIESFAQANALTLFSEFQIAYGLIKREDFEKKKSELMAQQSQQTKNGSN